MASRKYVGSAGRPRSGGERGLLAKGKAGIPVTGEGVRDLCTTLLARGVPVNEVAAQAGKTPVAIRKMMQEDDFAKEVLAKMKSLEDKDAYKLFGELTKLNIRALMIWVQKVINEKTPTGSVNSLIALLRVISAKTGMGGAPSVWANESGESAESSHELEVVFDAAPKKKKGKKRNG